MAITALPTAPARTDPPATFVTRADAWVAALAAFVTEANTDIAQVATNAAATAANLVLTNADVVSTAADVVSTAANAVSTAANAVSTTADAAAAAASAASAAAIAGAFVGTSTTSLLIEIATKVFTTQASEQYTVGIWMTAVSQANSANWMFGQVTGYSGTTLTIGVQVIGGSGTLADWNLSLAGARGATGATGVGLTSQATGFTATEGATPKTLTCDDNITVTNISKLDTAQSFTALKTFAGSATTLAAKMQSILENATISATQATGTITFDLLTQSVLYYTSDASGNFTVNFRGDGSTTLDSCMATGDIITCVFMVTTGGTAYYNNVTQVDGSTKTGKWSGGSAPTGGNANSVDIYTYTIVKTGAAAFTIFPSQTQFA